MGKIDRAALVEMFDNIRAKTNWDMSGDMLWGYFFTDTDPEKLARAGHLLAERGYRCVGVRPPEDDPGGLHWLHVERIETHSVDSLQTRNGELDDFADELDLHAYDGMDVGPVSQ
jgi:hypothetical protein